MGQPIRNSISTYRLRKDRLEEYLKLQFPQERKDFFNVHVSALGRPVEEDEFIGRNVRY